MYISNLFDPQKNSFPLFLVHFGKNILLYGLLNDDQNYQFQFL